MNKIILLDPSIGSMNEGDRIISDFIVKNIKDIFPNDYLVYLPTQMGIYSKYALKNLMTSDYTFVGGSNLLTSNMNKINQWKVNYFHLPFYKNIILFGTGWWQYQKKINLYTFLLLKRILSKEYMHSVRDEYTRLKLNEVGINNVLNTGCPTTWNLTNEFCKDIPHSKQDNVVFTLTDYLKDVENDKKMITILKNNFNSLYFWPQGALDLEYLYSITTMEKINIIKPGIENYKELLNSYISLEYIGTRLHGGIFALNFKKRTTIIAIDNRTKEMRNSININILERKEITQLDKIINSAFHSEIKIKENEIKLWKEQFI